MQDKDVEVYTTTIDQETYAVKLMGNPVTVDGEFMLQHCVRRSIYAWWETCVTGLEGCQSVWIPKPEALVRDYRFTKSSTSLRGFVTEYIRPLPLGYSKVLAKRYIDTGSSKAIQGDPNLAQVRLQMHLGELAPASHRSNTTLVKRPAYLDELFTEAPRMVERWAMTMGVTLAILHWVVRLDARGIKFQLGSDKKGWTKLWASDFGQCRYIRPWPEDVKYEMVPAVANSPYWPRPPTSIKYGQLETQVWDCFEDSYLRASWFISDKRREPQWLSSRMFIKELEAFVAQKSEGQ